MFELNIPQLINKTYLTLFVQDMMLDLVRDQFGVVLVSNYFKFITDPKDYSNTNKIIA
jgi:hypothetical protein